MDAAIDEQYRPEQFVTACTMHLDIATGRLQWATPVTRALLIHGHRVIRARVAWLCHPAKVMSATWSRQQYGRVGAARPAGRRPRRRVRRNQDV